MKKKTQYTNLYFELESRGISPESFAVQLSMKLRSVENWCYGYCKPFPKTRRNILKILGLETDTTLYKFRK